MFVNGTALKAGQAMIGISMRPVTSTLPGWPFLLTECCQIKIALFPEKRVVINSLNSCTADAAVELHAKS